MKSISYTIFRLSLCRFRLLLCLLFKVVPLFCRMFVLCVVLWYRFVFLFCSVVVLGCPFGLRVRPSYHRETTRQPYPPCPPLTTSPISVTTHSSWIAWRSPSSVMGSTHRPWLCFRGYLTISTCFWYLKCFECCSRLNEFLPLLLDPCLRPHADDQHGSVFLPPGQGQKGQGPSEVSNPANTPPPPNHTQTTLTQASFLHHHPFSLSKN